MARKYPRSRYHLTSTIVIIATLLVVMYAAWALSEVYDEAEDRILSSAGLIILHLMAGWFGMQLQQLKFLDARLRRGWFLLSLAAFSNVIGEAIWFFLESILKVEPFPSLADLFYLLYYPLTLLGVLLLPFAPMRRRDRWLLWLDLMIIMISAGMIFWYFVIGPLNTYEVAASSFERVVALAYPVGDLMLFAGLVNLFQRDVERMGRGALLLLMVSMVLLTFADGFFAYFEIHENYTTSVLLNVLWLGAALTLLGATVWQLNAAGREVPTAPVGRTRSVRTARLLLPYAAAAVGPLLLLGLINSNLSLDSSLQWLLYGTLIGFVLVLLRQYLVLVENMQLYQQMQRLATVDSLTGIYNRHSFNERFQQEVERAYLTGNPLSILLMDVDDFKKINDTYGHLQGDLVLQTVANELAINLRMMDVLARYGGDEFVVLLPGIHQAEAQEIAKRLEQAVAVHGIAGHPFGISIGVAQYERGVSAQQILEIADRALYQHKAMKKGGQDNPH